MKERSETSQIQGKDAHLRRNMNKKILDILEFIKGPSNSLKTYLQTEQGDGASSSYSNW